MNDKSRALIIGYDFAEAKGDPPHLYVIEQTGSNHDTVNSFYGDEAIALYEYLTGKIGYAPFPGKKTEKRTYAVKKVMFGTKAFPKLILAMMRKDVAQYGYVSVSDFYRYADTSSPDPSRADIQFGWVDLTSAIVMCDLNHVSYPYFICFPPAIELA